MLFPFTKISLPFAFFTILLEASVSTREDEAILPILAIMAGFIVIDCAVTSVAPSFNVKNGTPLLGGSDNV
ncbi:hypothetical protein D3C86_1761610 [compost metagenome]